MFRIWRLLYFTFVDNRHPTQLNDRMYLGVFYSYLPVSSRSHITWSVSAVFIFSFMARPYCIAVHSFSHLTRHTLIPTISNNPVPNEETKVDKKLLPKQTIACTLFGINSVPQNHQLEWITQRTLVSNQLKRNLPSETSRVKYTN